MTIANRSIVERDSGARNLVFTVSLSKASSQATNLRYTTSGGTATAGTRLRQGDEQCPDDPGGRDDGNDPDLDQGRHAVEPNETFNVRLTRPTALNITDATAVGTITNDD